MDAKMMATAQIVLGITLILLAIIGFIFSTHFIVDRTQEMVNNQADFVKIMYNETENVELTSEQKITTMNLSINTMWTGLTILSIISGTAIIIFIMGIMTMMQGLFNRRLSQKV